MQNHERIFFLGILLLRMMDGVKELEKYQSDTECAGYQNAKEIVKSAKLLFQLEFSKLETCNV
jgi:hypothetical protein